MKFVKSQSTYHTRERKSDGTSDGEKGGEEDEEGGRALEAVEVFSQNETEPLKDAEQGTAETTRRQEEVDRPSGGWKHSRRGGETRRRPGGTEEEEGETMRSLLGSLRKRCSEERRECKRM